MLQLNWFVFACVYGVGEGVDGFVCPCPPVHNFIVTPHHLFALLFLNEAPRLSATVQCIEALSVFSTGSYAGILKYKRNCRLVLGNLAGVMDYEESNHEHNEQCYLYMPFLEFLLFYRIVTVDRNIR